MRTFRATNAESFQRRREWVVILAMTAIGAYLRFRNFGRLGLTHFDEGVYASSGLWALSPRGLWDLDPQVIAYAPPAFPILIGLGYGLLGVSDAVPLLIALLCGVATIPALGWVGLRTFGPGAGASASAFCALSMAHLAFSRKALTDAPFLLCWVLGLGVGGWFLEKPSWRRALLLGAIIGLAQNVKYNGGLIGIVVALAMLAGWVASRKDRDLRSIARSSTWLVVAACVSAVIYLPWYRFVESHGGYASLMRHHASYTSGPAQWPDHLRLQLAQVVALSGTATWRLVAWAIAWFGAAFAAFGPRLTPTDQRWDRARFRLGGLVGMLVVFAVPDLGWWAGMILVPGLLRREDAGSRLVAVAWLALSIITPFYHPYARLWLPLHALGWLALAGIIARADLPRREAMPSFPSPTRDRVRIVAAISWALLVLTLGSTHWGPIAPHPIPDGYFFLPTANLRNNVDDAAMFSPKDLGMDVRLLVLGRRPLAFYLGLQGLFPIRLLPDESSLKSGSAAETDLVLLDETVLGHPAFDRGPIDPRYPGWSRLLRFESLLDPITQLDVDPEAAFEFHIFDKPAVILIAPTRLVGEILKKVPSTAIEDFPPEESR